LCCTPWPPRLQCSSAARALAGSAADAATGAAQSYAQRLEGALADKADEVSALRGQLACAPYPDPLDSPEHPQAIEAELF
jgi:hypothetical protein